MLDGRGWLVFRVRSEHFARRDQNRADEPPGCHAYGHEAADGVKGLYGILIISCQGAAGAPSGSIPCGHRARLAPRPSPGHAHRRLTSAMPTRGSGWHRDPVSIPDGRRVWTGMSRSGCGAGMPCDRRDRPSLATQRVRIHVFLSREHPGPRTGRTQCERRLFRIRSPQADTSIEITRCVGRSTEQIWPASEYRVAASKSAIKFGEGAVWREAS